MRSGPLIHIGALALLAAILLAGCRPVPTPTPTPAPPTPTLAPTAIPATATPEGWVEQRSGDLTIWLPREWEVFEFDEGDLQMLFDNMSKTNPELAKMIGNADALHGVALWAFRAPDTPTAFTDNLNIRRSPLGGQKIEKMQEVVDVVVAQYGQLGFEVTDTQADLTIDGLPAAHLAYTFSVTGNDGQPIAVVGNQYLVATSADLWILSYSADAADAALLAPVFERSALSFRVQ